MIDHRNYYHNYRYRNTNISIFQHFDISITTDNDNGGEKRRAHSAQPTRKPPAILAVRFVVFGYHSYEPVTFGPQSSTSHQLSGLGRAAVYTAIRDKDHAPAVLLFGAVFPSPLAGVSLFIVPSYYRIIVYRYRFRTIDIVSVRYDRIVIER